MYCTILLVRRTANVQHHVLCVQMRLFSYTIGRNMFWDAHKNRLIETILLSTQNGCFG